MAAEGQRPSTEERVRRSVRRTLSNLFLGLAVLGLLGLWASLGAFTLKPGEAAVLLRFGRHVRTIMQDGFHIVPPPPFYERVIVNFSGLRNEDFGVRGREGEESARDDLLEAIMQTSGNNIVHLSFAVQYTIKDPFLERFRLADPEAVVRDAAQAAMRQVVGGMTVDGVLREQRALVASEVTRLLQEVLDSYEAGLDVRGVQLLAVEPPGPVRGAFDDVVSATQDGTRLVNEAEGYRNEVLPKAQAEAAELRASASAFRDATIAEATGQAQRFSAIAAEWRKAPAVTEKRLYLETMESILPDVEKVIIEPGTTQVLPYLPLERRNGGAAR
jgi:membrane protease subunit HflK